MSDRPVGEPSNFRAHITMPGQKDKRRGRLQRLLTLEIISEWIKLQGFDEYTTNGLIAMASKYPTQALPSFRKNFNLMIERVRAKRRAELRGIQERENNANQIKNTNAQPQGDIQGVQTGGEHAEGAGVERHNGA